MWKARIQFRMGAGRVCWSSFFFAMILKFGFGAQSKGPTGVAPNRDELHYRVWIRGYASHQSDQKACNSTKMGPVG